MEKARKANFNFIFLGICAGFFYLTSCNPVKFWGPEGLQPGTPAPQCVGSECPQCTGNNCSPCTGPSCTQCLNQGCNPTSPLATMGLVTDHVKCAICHMNVRGNIAATSTEPFALHPASSGTIWGNVYTNNPIVNPTPAPSPNFNGYGVNSDPTHILMQGAGEPISGTPPNVVFNSVAVKTGLAAPLDFQIFTNNPTVNFVFFNSGKIKAQISGGGGTVKQNGTTVFSGIFTGNLVLDGTTNPIDISGEVYVTGDLIIRGNFTGLGTIYVEKSIYIPSDIKVSGVDTLFSNYISNLAGADQTATQAVTDKAAGLRLAANRYIFIGNLGKTFLAAGDSLPPGTLLKNYFFGSSQAAYPPDPTGTPNPNANPSYNTNYQSYYTGETIQSTDDYFGLRSRTDMVDAYLQKQKESIGFDMSNERLDVYKWYPNYTSLLKPEYELGTGAATKVCGGKQFRVPIGAVSRIDAVLYGQEGIGGVNGGGGNIVINGGVITQRLALLGGTGWNLFTMAPLRSKNIYEFLKTCAGGGTWSLSRSTVNPETGLEINLSEIRYDYRLRNQGAGFNVMRAKDYFAKNFGPQRAITSVDEGKKGIWGKFKNFLVTKFTKEEHKSGSITMPSQPEMLPDTKGAPPLEYYRKKSNGD